MEWVRGTSIGCGSFGSVNLVVPKKGFPNSASAMAVKSCETINSGSLKNEKQVLDQIGLCPQIIRCFGDDYTVENRDMLYNLFLEYADKGSLVDQVQKTGKFMESDVKRYTRSILKGLCFIHAKGYVHCDIKLQNILLFGNGEIKIADFGLAKKNRDEEQRKLEIRGTPLNLAPESVNENEYNSPVDIWALGCTIVEMLTGKPAWNLKAGSNVSALLMKIGVSDELPGIPADLSEEGKDFLGKCFVKDPNNRWTAEMLLSHPFMGGGDDEETSVSSNCSSEEFSISPRCPFDFPDWVSAQSTASSLSTFRENSSIGSSFSRYISSPLDRIRQLGCDRVPNWSVSGSWITLR